MTDMEKLLEALKEVRDDIDFAGQYGLVDEGVIDSLDLTQIIAALDEAFDIHIPSGEIEPENFNSVQDLLALVKRYQALIHGMCLNGWKMRRACLRMPSLLTGLGRVSPGIRCAIPPGASAVFWPRG